MNTSRVATWLSPEHSILDYGCGYGRALGLLSSRGYHHLIGVDPSPAMIVEARRRFPVVRFEQIVDPPHVDLPAASVDAVLLFSVLTCVPTDDGQRAILRESGRMLRPGGLLYISDLWLQTDARNVSRYVRDQPKYGTYGIFDLPEGVTVRHHGRQWVEALTVGFEALRRDDISVRTMNGHTARGFQWFARKASIDNAV